MPLDDQGNYVADLPDYLRRSKMQDAIFGQDLPTEETRSPEAITTVDHRHYWAESPSSSPSPEVPYGDTGQGPTFPQSEKLQQVISQEPLKENYHPSKLRKVLSTIAGIGSGFAGGPALGEYVYNLARNSPYTQQAQNYGQREDIQGRLAQGEQGIYKAQTQGEELVARRKAEQERAGAEAARRKSFEWGISPEGQEFELKKLQIQHPKTTPNIEGPYEAITQDGKTIGVQYLPEPGLWKNTETGELMTRSQLKKISEKGKSIKDSSNLTGVLAEDVQAQNIVAEAAADPTAHPAATVEAAKNYLKLRNEGRDPTSAFGEVVKTKEQELGRKLTSAELTKIQRDLQPVQAATLISPEGTAIRPTQGQRIPEGSKPINQLGDPTLVRDRKFQATVIKRAGDNLIQKIEANRDKLGHLEDYWKQFTSNSPIADKNLSGLMTSLASFAALQPNLHGFRGANALREFERNIGGIPKDPDALIASIQAIQDTADLFNEQPNSFSTDEINQVRNELQKRGILK